MPVDQFAQLKQSPGSVSTDLRKSLSMSSVNPSDVLWSLELSFVFCLWKWRTTVEVCFTPSATKDWLGIKFCLFGDLLHLLLFSTLFSTDGEKGSVGVKPDLLRQFLSCLFRCRAEYFKMVSCLANSMLQAIVMEASVTVSRFLSMEAMLEYWICMCESNPQCPCWISRYLNSHKLVKVPPC